MDIVGIEMWLVSGGGGGPQTVELPQEPAWTVVWVLDRRQVVVAQVPVAPAGYVVVPLLPQVLPGPNLCGKQTGCPGNQKKILSLHRNRISGTCSTLILPTDT